MCAAGLTLNRLRRAVGVVQRCCAADGAVQGIQCVADRGESAANQQAVDTVGFACLLESSGELPPFVSQWAVGIQGIGIQWAGIQWTGAAVVPAQ